MTTRRTFFRSFLQAGAMVAGFTGCASNPRGGARVPSGVVVEETKTISHQPDIYLGWPTLLRRGNGDLLLVYSGGREAHVCPFGRVELMSSIDEGRTWSDPRVILDGPIDDRDAGILETSKGTLLVTSFTSLAYEPILKRAIAENSWPHHRLEKWRAAHERFSADERNASLGQWMTRSEDGGRSWSERYPSIVNSPHGPIQLADGRLLYAGKELWTGRRQCGFCESRDDGNTWRWLATLPVRDGDQMEDYHELHVVEANTGKLVVHIRNHNTVNNREILQSESLNGGRTWSTPHEIGVWGLPSHLLKLNDGSLLMTYGHRRQPFGNQVRLSRDEGTSWSGALILSGESTNGDLGYPSTVELDDNALLSVWYELPENGNRAVLRQARWRFQA